MLSFCSSFKEVERWVPSPASTKTWLSSSAKAMMPSAKTFACASLICKPSAEPPLMFALLSALSKAKISKSPSSASPVSPVVPSASTLIWSMPAVSRSPKPAVKDSRSPRSTWPAPLSAKVTSAESVKVGKPLASRLIPLMLPSPKSTVRLSPPTITVSMLSFCSSFKEVDRWVPSPASTKTWLPSENSKPLLIMLCAWVSLMANVNPLLFVALARLPKALPVRLTFVSTALSNPVAPEVSALTSAISLILIWSMPLLSSIDAALVTSLIWLVLVRFKVISALSPKLGIASLPKLAPVPKSMLRSLACAPVASPVSATASILSFCNSFKERSSFLPWDDFSTCRVIRSELSYWKFGFWLSAVRTALSITLILTWVSGTAVMLKVRVLVSLAPLLSLTLIVKVSLVDALRAFTALAFTAKEYVPLALTVKVP